MAHNRDGQGPEPASINSLFRQHGGTRLYVRPLHWTSDHLGLLDCRFERGDIVDLPWEENGLTEEAAELELDEVAQDASEYVKEAVRQLCSPREDDALAKSAAVTDLLDFYRIEPVKCRGQLVFRFACRSVADLPNDGVFWRPARSGEATCMLPSLAYVDLGKLPALRRKTIKLAESERPNSPVARLEAKTLKRISPAVETEDPYIAAVLIGLAQTCRLERGLRHVDLNAEAQASLRHAYRIPPDDFDMTDARRQPVSADIEVCLLASTASEPEQLYFFRACIPTAFLDKFDLPSRGTPADPPDTVGTAAATAGTADTAATPGKLVISYWSIPLAPVGIFQRRLNMMLLGDGPSECSESE